MELGLVGVLGAGVMGRGLAQALAQAGLEVRVVDVAREQLDGAREEIARNLRLGGLLGKEGPATPPEVVLGRIAFSEDPAPLAGATFVIENVTEAWAVKEAVFRQLDAICTTECILASDTSAIPIGRLAALVREPGRVLGIHFMNPVPLVDTVEVIRAEATTDATLERARALLERMGKQGVVVNDAPGFVSNRVLMLTVNEAVALVEDGVASARDVDRIFRQCFGHKMGPLETADMIGLDTIRLSLIVLRDHLEDDKFEPRPLLTELVRDGRLGRKSGEGFFRYTARRGRSSERETP
jgi:3-hydroxybutyryl-CoA dehydrogenase